MTRLARPLLTCVLAWAIFTALLWLGAPLFAAAHEIPPAFNNPTVQGSSCSDYDFQYDTGAERMVEAPVDYYNDPGEWVPYLVPNGPGGYTRDPEACNSRASGVNYATFGELGATVSVELRKQPLVAIEPGERGFVFWATGYTYPSWTYPWGWLAIDPETIYATWEFNTTTHKIFDNGVHVGWRRHFTNPTSQALLGTRVYLVGAITNSDTSEGKFSQSWFDTFTDILP